MNKLQKLLSTKVSFFTVAAFLMAVAPVDAQDVSRKASWDNENTVFNGNSHGSTLNPTAAVWSYYQQAGRDADGQQILNLTPSSWTPLSFSVNNDRFYIYEPNGGRGRGLVEATNDDLTTSWNITSGTPPIDAFRPSWAITTYTELNPEGGSYTISGNLSWGVTGAVPSETNIIIAKISGNDVKELYRNWIKVTAVGVTEIFNNDSIPESLQSITLAQGEQLVFAISGDRTQYRTITLYDSGLNLTMIPEPRHAVTLIGIGLLAMLVVRCRRRG